MSKKKILDYNPKTGFGNFAEIMNANNAIDMAQNRVNMPSAPITPTPVASAQAASAIPNQTPPLTDAVDATVTQNGGIPNATNTQTTVPQIPNVPDTGSVSTPATDPSATLLPTQNVGTTSIVEGRKGYEEWMTANGFDPDTEYDNARAALEYDYQTSMATYGRRAEELAQMGLSNSGISDVYQLGAFNTYLANQNALANQKIAAKKKNRQDYEAYVNAFNAQEEAEIGNAATALIQSNYTQDRENSVRDLYRARGWSEEKIDKLIGQLNAYSGAFDNKIQNEFRSIIDRGSYDPDAKETLWKLYSAENWTREEFDKLIEKLDDYYGTAAEETIDKVVNEDTGAVTIDQMLESLNNVAQSVGKDSESYIAEKNKVADKIADTINWALEPDDEGSPKRLGDAEVATALGFDAEEWAKKSDGEREAAVMDAAGEMKKDGIISSDHFNSILKTTISEEIKDVVDKDNGNWTATGLKDSGKVASKLMSYKDSGYLNDEEYTEFIDQIISEMSYKLDGNGEINWYGTVKSAEASVTVRADQPYSYLPKGEESDAVLNIYNDLKNSNLLTRKDDRYVWIVYNNTLYRVDEKASEDKILSNVSIVQPNQVAINGDGELFASDVERQGVAEIFKRLLYLRQNQK